jgi:uncharacterized protein YihD (DUF1040 family)
MRNTLNDLLNAVIYKETAIERLQRVLKTREEQGYIKNIDLEVLSLIYEYGLTSDEAEARFKLQKGYVEELLKEIRSSIIS